MRELKKYPNRRLYDLTDSRYVTIDDARGLIVAGEQIRVVDSEDGSDITRAVLLHILVAQESAGAEVVLSDRAIEQLIRIHGKDGSQHLSPRIEQCILALEAEPSPLPPVLRDPDGWRLDN